jgi:glycosyltransferase involved in cell wall biosynthesis
MKIAYICSYSEIAYGGDSRVAWELARYMAKNTDDEIWMLCPGEKYCIKKDNIEPLLQIQYVPSVYVTEGVGLFSPTLSNVSSLYNLLDNLNPDILHAHNFDPLAFVLEGWALTRKRPFVYTGHLLATQINQWQDFNLGKAMEGIISTSLKTYTREFYRNCTKIICLNKYAKDDFVRFTKAPEKMAVIPNGHIFDNYLPKSVNIEKDNEYNLLFPGYISERKNQLFLIEMLKYLKTPKKVTLSFAGLFMTKEYEKLVKQAIKTLPRNRRVRLLGYVKHEKLPSLYSKTHYMVSGALAEVQSLSVIESLASGTPVIGLANTTTSELLRGNNGRVLEKEASPEKFAKILDDFLSISNSKYEDLSKESIKSVGFLDYKNVSKQYSHFYSSLLRQKNIIHSKSIANRFRKVFHWKAVNSRKGGNRITYNLALGIVSTAIVAGAGAIKTYNTVKKYTKKT